MCIPCPCIITATWHSRKTFSQWEHSFHWKLCSHWLKGLRHRRSSNSGPRFLWWHLFTTPSVTVSRPLDILEPRSRQRPRSGNQPRPIWAAIVVRPKKAAPADKLRNHETNHKWNFFACGRLSRFMASEKHHVITTKYLAHNTDIQMSVPGCRPHNTWNHYPHG